MWFPWTPIVPRKEYICDKFDRRVEWEDSPIFHPSHLRHILFHMSIIWQILFYRHRTPYIWSKNTYSARNIHIPPHSLSWQPCTTYNLWARSTIQTAIRSTIHTHFGTSVWHARMALEGMLKQQTQMWSTYPGTLCRPFGTRTQTWWLPFWRCDSPRCQNQRTAFPMGVSMRRSLRSGFHCHLNFGDSCVIIIYRDKKKGMNSGQIFEPAQQLQGDKSAARSTHT